jgi:hypothetical protein
MQGLEKAFGFVPNVSAVLAESPATLKAYMTLSKIFDESAFTPVEREVVILGVAMKTISNYSNHIADTPLDEAFAGAAWKPGGAG